MSLVSNAALFSRLERTDLASFENLRVKGTNSVFLGKLSEAAQVVCFTAGRLLHAADQRGPEPLVGPNQPFPGRDASERHKQNLAVFVHVDEITGVLDDPGLAEANALAGIDMVSVTVRNLLLIGQPSPPVSVTVQVGNTHFSWPTCISAGRQR